MLTDYIFIVLAVVCFAAQFALTRLYEEKAGQATASTLVMLTVTSLVGAIIFFFSEGGKIQISRISLIWAALFAVIMIPYYMIGIKVLAIGSLAIYSMFMMLGGMLVPFLYGIIFLNEEISIGKIAGTVFLTLFIVLQAVWQGESTSKTQSSRKNKYLFFILCLVIFFINGMTGVIAKAHSISEGAVNEASFSTLYCAMTAVLSLFSLLIFCARNREEKIHNIKKALRIKPLFIMILLGAAAYGGNFLQLLAADKVPASVQFPLVSGGVIILSALVSALLFKDNLSKKEWISVIGAFLSTFLFAF